MKRAISILLLVVVFYQFVGAVFVYGWWLRSVKMEAGEKAERIESSEHTLLKLPASWEERPPAELTWHGENEFRYRGEMYDVVRSERHGDYTWYYVYWDRAETELMDNISSYVSDALKQNADVDRQRSAPDAFLKQIFLVRQKASVPGLPAAGAADQGVFRSFSEVVIDVDPPPPRARVHGSLFPSV